MNKHMYRHLSEIKYLYGDDAYVQMPNDIFCNIFNNVKSFQQSSFTYSYLVLNAFLYKYAMFVDLNNKTYIQNSDIKQILGYSRTTKSVDYIIKNGGVLDKLGLTKTTREYPVITKMSDEKLGKINMIEFELKKDIFNSELESYKKIKETILKIVKNKNYQVKIPIFLFELDNRFGTLYDYSNTHKIKISEFIKIIYNTELSSIGFLLYAYLKSRCFYNKIINISTNNIMNDTGACRYTANKYIKKLESLNYININNINWSDGRELANEYFFIGT